MKNDIMTVDQVSNILKLHAKTVRRYIKEGKLEANKVGGQWRVTQENLNRFLGTEQDIPESIVEIVNNSINKTKDPIKEKVQVTTIVDVYVQDKEEAIRICNTVFAVMNCKDPADTKSRCDHIYYESESKARFILWGSLEFITNMLGCISEISN